MPSTLDIRERSGAKYDNDAVIAAEDIAQSPVEGDHNHQEVLTSAKDRHQEALTTAKDLACSYGRPGTLALLLHHDTFAEELSSQVNPPRRQQARNHRHKIKGVHRPELRREGHGFIIIYQMHAYVTRARPYSIEFMIPG